MDSDDYQKTEMELLRDARVAELALHLQPVQVAAKVFGASIAKRKSTKEQETQVLPLPTHKSSRVGNKDTTGGGSNKTNSGIVSGAHVGAGAMEMSEACISSSDETKTNDSGSSKEGNEDNLSEEDNDHLREKAPGSSNKRMRHAVPPPPSLRDGLEKQPVQQSPAGQWQWQWVPPPSVPPPPTQISQWVPPSSPQLQQWAMVESRVPPYSVSWQGQAQLQEGLCRSDSAERSARRKKQKELKKKSVARSGNGRKPSAIHVNSHGEIDAASQGKTAWDQSMRAFVPLILDMSIVEWDKHRPYKLKKLRDTLDAEFEYLGKSLSNKGFRNAVKRFLKGERCRLKKLFVAGEEDCPVHIEPDQWERLKAYWGASDQVKKSKMMSNVRAQVQNVSKRGRRGKAGEEADVTKERDQSPGLYKIAEGLQVSEAAGSSAVTSVHAEINALKSRQDDFEKFKVEILSSSNRTAKAVEALEAALMRFLQKENTVEGDQQIEVDQHIEGDQQIEGATKMAAGGPSVPSNPTGEINVVDDPYGLDNNDPNLEIGGGQQSWLKDDGNENTEKDNTEDDVDDVVAIEDQPIESSKKKNCLEHDGNDESVTEGDKPDVVLLDGPMVDNEALKNPSTAGDFSMQLRRGKDRQKPPARRETTAKLQPTRNRKFNIGQQVSLLNPASPRQIVASGTITAGGGGPGPQQYHGEPILEKWYRLDVAHALGGFTDLMHPNPQGDEYKLKDVVGGNTIWDEQYMVLIARCAGLISSECKGKVGGKLL